MFERSGVATILAVALATLLACGERPGDPGVARPFCPECNVVLISIDTLRADHLEAYGYARRTSPHLGELAAESLVFTDVTAQSPWTLSSQMSMLTSLYPSRHGVKTRRDRLSDSIPTLASLLRREGYLSVAFTGGAYMRRLFNYHGFDRHDDSGKRIGSNFEAMLSWLRNQGDRRFFLFWQDYRVHCPYAPEPRYDVFSDADYAGKVVTEYGCAVYYSRLLPDLRPADIEYIRDKYDASILHIDERVAAMVDTLRHAGIWDSTLLVFTSDHGESFAEREQRPFIGHHLMYEEVLRVPLMMRIPGIEGRAIERSVESIDIMPTILALLGIDIPADLDGIDLLEEATAAQEEAVYSEHFAFNLEYSVKYGGYKLIHTLPAENRERVPEGLRLPPAIATQGLYELYDLEADPGETTNRFGSGLPIEHEMMKLLEERRLAESREAPAAKIDEQTREELEALGYLSP
jgi:arylsulfatase A-like enzyme